MPVEMIQIQWHCDDREFGNFKCDFRVRRCFTNGNDSTLGHIGPVFAACRFSWIGTFRGARHEFVERGTGRIPRNGSLPRALPVPGGAQRPFRWSHSCRMVIEFCRNDCPGGLAGALAARWAPGTPGAYGENVRAACRIALRVNGGLTILVAAALFFVIGRMTDHPSMVIAVFHLLLAGFSLWRTRSAVMPIASGVFGLVFGLFLLFLASVSAHTGPLAVIAIYACAASALLTGCSATAVAIVGR